MKENPKRARDAYLTIVRKKNPNSEQDNKVMIYMKNSRASNRLKTRAFFMSLRSPSTTLLGPVYMEVG